MYLLPVLFIYALLLGLAGLFAYGIVLLSTGAVVFSRIALALLFALIGVQNGLVLVATSGFLNYVAWLVIALGGIYLLSTLPRVGHALKFFSTILASIFAINLTVMLFGGVISALLRRDFQVPILLELGITLVCAVVSGIALLAQEKRADYDLPKNPILNILERGLASVLYGLSAVILCSSTHGNWALPGIVSLLVLIVGTAGAYVADIYLRDKDIFGLEGEKPVAMPR